MAEGLSRTDRGTLELDRVQVGRATAVMRREPSIESRGGCPKLGRGRTYVGLSGGIGSGKSTVTEALADSGATVISADELARAVVEPGTPGFQLVVQRFGDAVLAPNGHLNRAELASIVFDDAKARADLEAITHPRIAELAKAQAEAATTPVVVYEVPLLVERGMADQFDLVLMVDAPEEVRVERLVSRGLTADDARARIAAQASAEERDEIAHVWIRNHGSERDLRGVVGQVFNVWLRNLS